MFKHPLRDWLKMTTSLFLSFSLRVPFFFLSFFLSHTFHILQTII